MRAVHFGAGNIGRGFIGLLLHQSGYHVTYADVNADLIAALNAADTYTVREVGVNAREHVVDQFDAIDSSADPQSAVAAVAAADVVTCAVGPNVLKFIAPVIRDGLAARSPEAPKLVVMACENAIGATDTLAGFVLERSPELAGRAIFANTAVDRIIPGQSTDGIDVVVEDFSEWSIDRRPFDGREPSIDGAHFVDDLEPYIERKLFTVNTGHATVAYAGYLAGIETIAEALQDGAIRAGLDSALADTSALLIAKFSFDPIEHAAYVQRTIERFANPELPDTCIRIGRQPLRKLSRHERFIGPAAELAERGLPAAGIIAAAGNAFRFAAPEDPEAVELQELRERLDAGAVVERVAGLSPDHPLFNAIVAVA